MRDYDGERVLAVNGNLKAGGYARDNTSVSNHAVLRRMFVIAVTVNWQPYRV